MDAIRIEMPKNTRNLLECFAIRFINAWLHIMSAVAIDMVVSSLEVVGFLVGIAHAKGLLLSIPLLRGAHLLQGSFYFVPLIRGAHLLQGSFYFGSIVSEIIYWLR